MSSSVKKTPLEIMYHCPEADCCFECSIAVDKHRPFMTPKIKKANVLASQILLFLSNIQKAVIVQIFFDDVEIICPECSRKMTFHYGFNYGMEENLIRIRYDSLIQTTTTSVSAKPVIDIEAIRAKQRSQRTTEDWKHLADNLGKET